MIKNADDADDYFKGISEFGGGAGTQLLFNLMKKYGFENGVGEECDESDSTVDNLIHSCFVSDQFGLLDNQKQDTDNELSIKMQKKDEDGKNELSVYSYKRTNTRWI